MLETSRWALLAGFAGTIALVVLSDAVPRRPQPRPQPTRPASFLYVWTGDADSASSDFLAVIDVRPASATYAQVISTVPVGAKGTGPHHTEHQVERDGILFANGFGAGRTFRFDVNEAATPKLLGSFTTVGDYSYPHSFVQLGGGHLLGTFQGHGPTNTPPGGLVELDRQGRLVRASSARSTGFDTLDMRPYSLAVLPAIDRVVSTSTDMLADHGAHLQIWRLSDLALLHTIPLPQTATGDGHQHQGAPTGKYNEQHHLFPGEPRTLTDGKTVLLATFTCGFYRVRAIDTPSPTVDFVKAFGGLDCAVPVLVGNVWAQTIPDEHAVVTLDVSDAMHPRELARVTFDSTFRPHWMAFDAPSGRLVVNDGDAQLHLVAMNATTGALAIDSAFRDRGAKQPGVRFDRASWPHGATGPAKAHGSVFSRDR